ncbi:hypothetical protein CYMTET_15201, partial [Cymbomonas tetramitiformis]
AIAWLPPKSPFGLLEEILWHDPWKLLLSCMMLNQTGRRQVDRVLWRLFHRFPSASCLAQAAASEVEELVMPLGLHRKRAQMLIKFSQQYLQGDWQEARELHGIGKYADDAYRIFCKGEWKDSQPDDHALNWYHQWLVDECKQ